MNLTKILQQAVTQKATDIFIIAGKPITIKVYSKLLFLDDTPLKPNDTEILIKEIYSYSEHHNINKLIEHGDDDFPFSIAGLSRFRVNAYKQRGSYAAVIRVISFTLPDIEELHIDKHIIELCDINKGLILVTGPASVGKSTTQACMIDYINRTQTKHIITLEDPIEHLHPHKKSIVSQREISIDSDSYITALRATLRQSPDIILIGELRDYESISIALTAAETGHTVISTLHTLGAATTIDRIIDVFPANQQHQIALQLSMNIETIICQQLLPTIDGRLIPAFEIMNATPAIRNLIRENKIHQIDGMISSSSSHQMISMDTSIISLYKQGLITKEVALEYAMNQELMKRKLSIE